MALFSFATHLSNKGSGQQLLLVTKYIFQSPPWLNQEKAGQNETRSFTAEGHPLPPADTRTLDNLLPPTVYNSRVLTNLIWSFWAQLWKIWLLALSAILNLVSRNHAHYKRMWVLHPVKAVTHFFQGKENEERLKLQWLILNVASNFITSNILNFQKTFHTDPTYK